MPQWTVKEVFERGGLFSQALSDYEMRQPQIDLALSIASGLENGDHIAAEGPTGTGKSLAYLVPAIHKILTDKGTERDDGNCRVVVATSNIALQEQLYFKDLPFLASVLPDEFNYALVKGRNNYLCKDSLNTFRMEKAQLNLKFGEDLTQVPLESVFSVLNEDERTICEWSKTTEAGDKSELLIDPNEETWRQFSVTAEECLGTACSFSGECFANKARKALQNMDVIVVNYHLLFAAIAVRMETGKNIVLPPFRFLVCDEAHKVADISRDFFGWNLSKWGLNKLNTKFSRIISNARNAGLDEHAGEEYGSVYAKTNAGISQFLSSIEKFYADSKGAVRIRSGGQIHGEALADAYTEMGGAFDEMSKLPMDEKYQVEAKKGMEKALSIAANLREISLITDSNGVYYLERFGRSESVRVVKKLIDVSEMLWNGMFCKTDATVITSATLAIDGNCSYIRDEVGMRVGREIIVDSPFNFKEQACLILSANAPDPKKADYPDRVAKAMTAIISQAEGRTLGLFTSYRVLHHVAEYLKKELPQYRFLVQGEAPRMWLVKEFQNDIGSVLLGTESFWTGVDVPGESLSCLIIDKIPFPSPGDPVLEALTERAGEKGFWDIHVPRAVLQFRQGVGRLIRRATDRGVIAVLDNRLVTKGYGSIFTRSLPRMTRASGIRNGQVRNWLNVNSIQDREQDLALSKWKRRGYVRTEKETEEGG